MKTLSVKLPDPLARWLRTQARELRRTQSDLVRQAIEAQRQGKKKRQESEVVRRTDG